ncbi:hypothetical protein BGZ72_010209 [Mortierella alpina]|nr:hypothetical protein BGZ72_010209 [Mortierella alpina]
MTDPCPKGSAKESFKKAVNLFGELGHSLEMTKNDSRVADDLKWIKLIQPNTEFNSDFSEHTNALVPNTVHAFKATSMEAAGKHIFYKSPRCLPEKMS